MTTAARKTNAAPIIKALNDRDKLIVLPPSTLPMPAKVGKFGRPARKNDAALRQKRASSFHLPSQALGRAREFAAITICVSC